MSRIQSKITQHTKKQENITHSQHEKQPTENNTEITMMLEFADKAFKTVTVTLLKDGKENTITMNKRKF